MDRDRRRPRLTSDAGAAAYQALILSPRVSARTRTALLARGKPDDPAYCPAALSRDELELLRAAVDRIVPQSKATAIDVGARIDQALGAGEGDGWRFATLPSDPAAYRAGLAALDAAAHAAHGQGFVRLGAGDQDALLARTAGGDLSAGPDLDAAQLQRWFEDLRADAVKVYVAHPATLVRMGYSGIAYGGDGERKQGFHDLEPGASEAWEPVAAVDAA